jgi:hypothetical protein
MAWIRSLYDAAIPKEIVDIMSHLSPGSLPNHYNVVFTPSFGSYSHKFDFSRSLHPALLILSHNAFFDNDRAPVHERKLHAQPILIVDSTTYHFGNYIAKFFNTGTPPQWKSFSTYLNAAFCNLTTPYTVKFHTRRSLFSSVPYTPPNLTTSPRTLNPYDILLLLDEQNLFQTERWISSLNDFICENIPDFVIVKECLSTSTDGIFHHTIFPPSIPTSSTLSLTGLADCTTDTPHVPISSAFADLSFGTPFSYGKSAVIPALTDENSVTRALYLVNTEKSPGNITATPTLIQSTYTYHDILLYSPTPDSTSSHHRTLTTGITIENDNLDSIGLYLENPDLHLQSMKSKIIQFAVPYSKIRSLCSDPRFLHPRVQSPPSPGTTLFALYDSTKNILPKYRSPFRGTPALGKFYIQPGSNGSAPLCNVECYSTDATPLKDDDIKFISIWSSYRLARTNKTPYDEDHFMIPSLSHLFGVSSELKKSPQLHLLLHL